MAIALYKRGKTHIIKGVECEMALCQVSSLQSMLNAGWVANVKDLADDSGEPEPEPKKRRGRPPKNQVESAENTAGETDDDNT